MLLHDPLFLLATAVCLVVLVILLIGIGTFGKGGEFNRKYANKLMQLRILAQGLAVVAIVLFAWARSNRFREGPWRVTLAVSRRPPPLEASRGALGFIC